jgi:WD40 repeat protein
MARVVCQVLAHRDRLTLLWSEDSSPFPPYTLEGAALADCRRLAAQAKGQLARLGGEPADAAALAATGHALFRLLFQLDQGDKGAGAQVHDWLRSKAPERLEILGDTAAAPWTALYDLPPAGADFQSAAAWQGFWGRRYQLSGGRRVQWLRGRQLPAKPAVVLALDPGLRGVVPADEQKRLADFLAAHAPVVVNSQRTLTEVFRTQDVDVLYLSGRAEADGIRLGDDVLTPGALEEAVFAERDGEGEGAGASGQTLLVLNPCGAGAGAAEGGAGLAVFERFSAVGMIGAWQPVAAAVGNRWGLELLTGLLQGRTVAEAMAAAGQMDPATGVQYFAAAPPELRAVGDGQPPPVGEPQPLPPAPYRPLAPLDEDTAPLLVGREFDIATVAGLLDDAGSRLVLVHGPAGVGKSSLLRAGVFPHLEDRCTGYRILRGRGEGEAPAASEDDNPILPVRATSDLAGQLALALVDFCARPFSYTTPAGQTITVDLPGLLATAAETGGEGPPAPEALRQALRRDPELLGEILTALTAGLPFELVVPVEQAEELFSLVQPGSAPQGAAQGLAMLRSTFGSPARARFLVSLRTEYLGRFVTPLQAGGDGAAVRTFLLEELSEEDLIAVILQPTALEPLPGTDVVPHQQYGFQYESRLAESIAREAVKAGANQESALAVVHAVCTRLWQTAVGREDKVAREADLKRIGGVEHGLAKYVDRLVAATTSGKDRKALNQLLKQLYIRQPDGALTRDLLPLGELDASWKGSSALPGLAATLAADNVRLLEVTWANINGREGEYVSLGSDALAPVAAQRAEEADRRALGWTKMGDVLWITVPLLVLVAVFAWTQMNALSRQREKSDEDTKDLTNEAKALQKENKNLAETLQAARQAAYTGSVHQAYQSYLAGDIIRARQALQAGKRSETDELRGFEWYYLWGLLNQERSTLYGHRGTVTGVAVTPDGLLAATAGEDGAVRLWNVVRGEEIVRFDLGTKQAPLAAWCVALSPDGRTLAAAGEGGVVRLWRFAQPPADPAVQMLALFGTFDLGPGAVSKLGPLAVPPAEAKPKLVELPGHEGPVRALAFSPDSKTLAAAAKDGVKLWDVAGEKPAVHKTLKDTPAPVLALAFAPGGEWLAGGGEDKVVRVWDAKTGDKAQALRGHGAAVAAVAWSGDGKTLASGGAGDSFDRGQLKLWDAGTWKEKPVLPFHLAPVTGLAFGKSGKTLVVAGRDDAIRFVSAETGAEEFALKGHLGWASSVAIARGGLLVVSGSHDGTAKVWAPRDLATRDTVKVASAPVTALAFGPESDLLAAAAQDGTILVWDLAGWREVKVLKGHKAAVAGLAWVQGKKLATADAAGVLKLWDVDAASETFGQELGSVAAHEGAITAVVRAAPNRLATASLDGTIKLWSTEGGKLADKPAQTIKADSPPTCLTALADAKLLASGHEDGKVRLWNSDTAAPAKLKTAVLPAHTRRVTAVSFVVLPGDETPVMLVLSASADRTLKLSDPVFGRLEYTARGHGGPVLSATASGPATLHFLTTGSDRTVKLWAAVGVTGKVVLVDRFSLPGLTSPPRLAAMSGNGRVAAAACEDGTVRLWHAADPTKVR